VIADSPFGKGKKYLQSGFAGKVLGNWQVDAVSILRSGQPFTVTASNTSLNASGSTQFGNCNAPPQQLGNIYEWYNTSAFSVPANGHIGTCGTNSLWGPGLINLDGSLHRIFTVTDRFKLTFTADGFNMANTPHHSNPTSSVSSGTFMQALGIANTGRDGIDERTFRFGLRLGW
jgi:hypothetical protein